MLQKQMTTPCYYPEYFPFFSGRW